MRVPGCLLTLLFTDVVGSTDFTSAFGEVRVNRLLRHHYDSLEVNVLRNGGELVKTLGDGAMAAFPSATGAIECAALLQGEMEAGAQADSEVALRYAVGLSAGEVFRRGSDIIGRAVVVAERLCGDAGPGQILATENVVRLAGDCSSWPFAPWERLCAPSASDELDGQDVVEILWRDGRVENAAPEKAL